MAKWKAPAAVVVACQYAVMVQGGELVDGLEGLVLWSDGSMQLVEMQMDEDANWRMQMVVLLL